MKTDPKLKERVIRDYVAENKKKYGKKELNLVWIKSALILFMIAIYAFLCESSPQQAVRKTCFYGLAVFVLIAASTLLKVQKEAKRAADELHKTRYKLEEDSIVKIVADAKTAKKRYRYAKIDNLTKDGDIISFDYGQDGWCHVDILDIYQPPLYEELKKRI